MMRFKYPLSLKIVLVIAIVVIVVILFVLPSKGSQHPHLILPDGYLPWNSSYFKVIEALNTLYEYKGKITEWGLCDTDMEDFKQMCLPDKSAFGPFKFHFASGRLVGYLAEFPISEYSNLIYSGRQIYSSHGVVWSASREFRVYEMKIRHGWLELYMVLDKDTRMIRLQAKYRYISSKSETKTPESDMEDQKAWEDADLMVSATPAGQTGRESLNSLNIQTLEPLPSKDTKELEVQLRLLARAALFQVLSEAGSGYFGTTK